MKTESSAPKKKIINTKTASEIEIRNELCVRFGWTYEEEYHPYLNRKVTYYSHPVHTYDPIKKSYKIMEQPIRSSLENTLQTFPYGYVFAGMEEMDDGRWIVVARRVEMTGPFDRIFAIAENYITAVFRLAMMCWNDKEGT